MLYPSATAAHDAAIAQRLRELERQFRLGAFERAVLTPPKLSPVLREIHGEAVAQAFKDAYSLVFLGLPTGHTEADVENESLRRFVGDMVFALTQEQRSSGGMGCGLVKVRHSCWMPRAAQRPTWCDAALRRSVADWMQPFTLCC